MVDAYGAAGSSAALVRVRTAALDLGGLRNVSHAKATAAIESGNADASKQVLAATTAALGASAESAQQRRLSSGGGATASVRAAGRTALSMGSGSQIHYRIKRKRVANQARPRRR